MLKATFWIYLTEFISLDYKCKILIYFNKNNILYCLPLKFYKLMTKVLEPILIKISCYEIYTSYINHKLSDIDELPLHRVTFNQKYYHKRLISIHKNCKFPNVFQNIWYSELFHLYKSHQLLLNNTLLFTNLLNL